MKVKNYMEQIPLEFLIQLIAAFKCTVGLDIASVMNVWMQLACKAINVIRPLA